MLSETCRFVFGIAGHWPWSPRSLPCHRKPTCRRCRENEAKAMRSAPPPVSALAKFTPDLLPRRQPKAHRTILALPLQSRETLDVNAYGHTKVQTFARRTGSSAVAADVRTGRHGVNSLSSVHERHRVVEILDFDARSPRSTPSSHESQWRRFKTAHRMPHHIAQYDKRGRRLPATTAP